MPEPIHPHRCPCKRCTGPRRAEELAAPRAARSSALFGATFVAGFVIVTLALLA